MQKTSTADKAKMIFLLLYFLILTIERVISLASVFTGDLASYDPLDWYMTALTVLSIIGAYAFIFTKCRMNVKKYPNGKVSGSPMADADNFGKLAVAAGILLQRCKHGICRLKLYKCPAVFFYDCEIHVGVALTAGSLYRFVKLRGKSTAIGGVLYGGNKLGMLHIKGDKPFTAAFIHYYVYIYAVIRADILVFAAQS